MSPKSCASLAAISSARRSRTVLRRACWVWNANWHGPLAANTAVDETFAQFQAMERDASPAVLRNWRFQQALYRAYYDAYTRKRLLYETTLEDQALQKLRETRDTAAAAAILDRAVDHPVAPEWHARIFELAEALFQSIGMQLSVPRYKAIGVDRGASLDTLDVPLNNRIWLERQFAEAHGDPAVIDRILQLDRSRTGRVLRRFGRPHAPAAPGAGQRQPGISCALAQVLVDLCGIVLR